MAILVGAFPKVGVSYAAKSHPDLIIDTNDTDKKKYSSLKEYIDILQNLYNKYLNQEKIITFLAAPEIMDLAKSRGLPFRVICPESTDKNLATCMLNCIRAGEIPVWAQYIYDNWNEWITDCHQYDHISLLEGMYFEDIIDKLLLEEKH